MHKYSLLLLFTLISFGALAQPYSAFVDIRQEFYAFDNGAINKLEHLKPVDYKIGKNTIMILTTTYHQQVQ